MKFHSAGGKKRMAVSLVWVVLWSWTATGCSLMRSGGDNGVTPPSVATEGEVVLVAVPVQPRNVDERGYELGKRSTIEIGEPLIHRRLYGEEDMVATARFEQSFEVHCGLRTSPFGEAKAEECEDPPLNELRARSGETWTVSGVRAGSPADKPIYMISKHVEGGTLYLLVDASGDLLEGRNVAWRSVDGPAPTSAGLGLRLVKLDVPLEVRGPLVELRPRHRVVRGPSHLNFDLLYSGRGRSRRGDSVRLLYREYSPYLAGRALHSEEFTYDLDQGTITFKNFRIRVHAATDRKITYTVESDAAKKGGG